MRCAQDLKHSFLISGDTAFSTTHEPWEVHEIIRPYERPMQISRHFPKMMLMNNHTH